MVERLRDLAEFRGAATARHRSPRARSPRRRWGARCGGARGSRGAGARSRRLPRPTLAHKLAAMSPFVPPYPERPREPLPLFAMMATIRRNFIAMFDEKCFEYQFFSTRLLNRRVFICNSPDTVAEAFIAMHESFQRKTPQMRHALSPLLGDGLFISDGDLWRRRRRIVAPIVHASRMAVFAPTMVEAAA